MLTNKIKAQMVLVATFFLGMVIGATGFYLYSRKARNRIGQRSAGAAERHEQITCN
jgi:hypothetical protein